MDLKLRFFVTDSATGAPVHGALIAIRLVPGGQPFATESGSVLAASTSDARGYGAVSLGLRGGPIDRRLTDALRTGLAIGTMDVAVVAAGDPKSGFAMLERLGALANLPAINAMRVSAGLPSVDVEAASEWLAEQMFGADHAEHIALDASVLPKEREAGLILDPDAIDYGLSPSSFIERRGTKLGQDGCEHIVPATLPEQVWILYRINLRHDLVADKERASPASNAETQVATVEGSPRPDPRLIFAELFSFQQIWTSMGHSLGEIRYSLALAPGEAVKMAVIDWSRTDQTQRSDAIRSREALLHDQTYDRDVEEIVSGDVKEQQGGFSAMLGGANASDVAMPQKGLASATRIAGGIGGSFTSGNRDMRANTQQDIHGGTLQRTSLRRNLNSTVVIQAGQAEKNYLSTRIVANMNRMHALTIQYYEVLRHLKVTTAFQKREWALLVPFHPFTYSKELAHRFRAQLEPVLLDARRAAGFDALERLAVGEIAYKFDDAATPGASAGASNPPRVTAEMTTRIRCTVTMGLNETPVGGRGPDTPGSVVIEIILKDGARRPLVQKGAGAANLFLNLKNPDGSPRASVNAGMTVYVEERLETFDPAQTDALNVLFKPSPFLLEDVNSGWDLDRVVVEVEVRKQWMKLFDWTSLPKFEIPTRFALPARSVTFPRRSDIFDGLVFTPTNVIAINDALGTDKVSLPSPIKSEDAVAVSDQYAKFGITRQNKNVLKVTLSSLPTNQPLTPEADAKEEASDPLSARRPTKDSDEVLAELLVNHLNANSSHYNAWSWAGMDKGERRMRLAMAAGPFADGLGDEPIGVIGNHVVLRYTGDALLANDAVLPDLEGKAPAPTASIVTLPTRGVFAEAHLGHCNGAEVRDITRMWNFDELPVSLLPNIEELRSGPRGQPVTIGQGQLPTPVVSIQPSPALPNPTGVAPVITGLGKGDTFRDMSGLDEVSAMIGELIKSANPPSLDKLLDAKEAVDKAKGTPKPAAEVTETPSPGVGISNVGDKLRLIDPLDVKMPQVLFDLEKSGGTERVFPPKSPRTSTPVRPPDSSVMIRFVPINAYGQKPDADIAVVISPSNGSFVAPMQTGWRSARRTGVSEPSTSQGYLPERIKNLRDGSIEVTVTMSPSDSATPLVNGVTVSEPFNFPEGTGLAVFEITQEFLEEEVKVNSGDTLETTLGANASFAPSISGTRNATLGGTIRAIEVSVGSAMTAAAALTLGGNWQEVKGKTYSTDKTFKVRIPLATIKIRQVSP